MEITGKLQIILPLTEGQGKNGTWKKQEFVIETADQYPKKICMNVWGDKVDEFRRYKIGDVLTCSLDISSREYNGKWYTDIRAWKIQAGGGNQGGNSNQNTNYSGGNDFAPMPDREPGISMDNGIKGGSDNWEGDLPF